MKKILVTGCAGFIGSHLCEHLLKMDYAVVGIDNFDPFYDTAIKKQNLSTYIHHPNFTFLEEDLTKDFESKLPEGIELVIHLAGKAGVRPSIEDPSSYIENNINATQNVLNMMKNKGIKKMAFASSSSVYGNTKETPFTEKMDVTNPISPYAATKKACELINHTAHHLHKTDIINMRFFTVFGPRQRPDLAIHKFTKLIREGKEITMFGDGSTARDYTYVDDTISGIMGAVQYLFENENVYETVNLGNNHPIVLKDMIQIIYQVTGEKANIKQLPMQAGDVDITFADISKAKELFNYEPKFNFNEGIKRFIDWYDTIKDHS